MKQERPGREKTKERRPRKTHYDSREIPRYVFSDYNFRAAIADQWPGHTSGCRRVPLGRSTWEGQMLLYQLVLTLSSLPVPPGAILTDYATGNLIRLGLAALVVVIMGALLLEAWCSQKESPRGPT